MDFLTDLDFDLGSVAGIALVVVGVWAAFKVGKTVVKLAMVAVVVVGLYLFFSS